MNAKAKYLIELPEKNDNVNCDAAFKTYLETLLKETIDNKNMALNEEKASNISV